MQRNEELQPTSHQKLCSQEKIIYSIFNVRNTANKEFYT